MSTRIIALDGGTSNTRAYLLDGMKVVGSARRSIGARDRALSASKEAMAAAAAECIGELLAQTGVAASNVAGVCAAGMLTSNVGLFELPHLAAPVDRVALSRGVVAAEFSSIFPLPIRFVRGVRVVQHTEAGVVHDMMRGEECETIGLLRILDRRGPAAVVLPGSHTKVVLVDEGGRIVDIRTTLAGEAIRAFAEATILADAVSKPLPAEFDPTAVAEGEALARRLGLLPALFQVRAAKVLRSSNADYCSGMLVGMIVGADVADLLRMEPLQTNAPIIVGGSNPLRNLYAGCLQRSGARAEIVVASNDAAAWALPVGSAAIAFPEYFGEPSA